MKKSLAIASRDAIEDTHEIRLSTRPDAAIRARRQQAHDAALGLLAATLVFVVLFWHLGTPSFWDPDEAHYAETSREMAATGDWWAPYYNEQPFFDKPVLFHQLQGTAMTIFGHAEFASRIVSALAALALVVITVWFGTTMVSAEVGIVAGLMLAASPGTFALARYAILDTVFTMFMFGGAACLTVAALRARPRLQWLGYVALAFGVLTKGPITLVLCGLTMLIAIGVSMELRRRLLGLRWVVGLALASALAAPWFVYMYLRFRQDFLNGYFLDENFRLFAGSRFGNQPGFWFYFRILAAGLLPWTGLLLGRLFDDVRAVVRRERLDGLEVLLWAWTLTVVAFFTLSTFKLDHYIFPAAPALCLLCARAWSDVRANQWATRNAGARVGLHLIGPFMVAIGLGCGYFLIARLDLPWAAAVVPIALTLAGVVLTALANVRGAYPPKVPWLVTIAMIVTYSGLIVFVLPALEQRKVIPDIARWVATRAQPTDRIASYRLNRWTPAYRFYVGRHVSFLEDPAEAEAFFKAPQPFYCVMRRNTYDEFVAEGARLQIVYEREGMSATSGRALWRTYTPMTRFVVAAPAQ
jgi:4-amino-4-deoxy-L-arabinose transferase-like glycosyltransferase